MMRSFPLLCLCLAWLLLGTLLPGQSLQLRDGRLLLATVEGVPDSEGLRVRRLDNGGVLDLRWEHLSTASAQALKRQHNLVGDAQSEPLVRADEVEYTFQGTRTVVVGRIVETTNEQLLVQKRGVQIPVRRETLSRVRSIDAPVTQVLTKKEYYDQVKDEVRPGDDPDKHMRVAEFLIQARDYENADTHLQQAKKIGGTRNPQLLEQLILRLTRFRDAEKELSLLSEIQVSRSSGRPGDFERGRRLIAQFEKEFPQAKLKAEFEAEKKTFTEARKRSLATAVALEFRRSIGIVAEKKIDSEGCTLDVAREYAQGQMTDHIVARLATQMKLDAAEVKELWAARVNYPVGKRPDQFDYGSGSWLLGEQGIMKGVDTKAAGKGAAAEEEQTDNREAERFRKMVQEAMKNRQRQMQQQGGGGEEEQTEEGWWSSAARVEKTSWLRAFYAEFSGQLTMRIPYVSSCSICYGRGGLVSIGGNGKESQSKCQACHGLKYNRSFKAF